MPETDNCGLRVRGLGDFVSWIPRATAAHTPRSLPAVSPRTLRIAAYSHCEMGHAWHGGRARNSSKERLVSGFRVTAQSVPGGYGRPGDSCLPFLDEACAANFSTNILCTGSASLRALAGVASLARVVCCAYATFLWSNKMKSMRVITSAVGIFARQMSVSEIQIPYKKPDSVGSPTLRSSPPSTTTNRHLNSQ